MSNTYISLHQVERITLTGTKEVPLTEGGTTKYVTLKIKLKDGSNVEITNHIADDFTVEVPNG